MKMAFYLLLFKNHNVILNYYSDTPITCKDLKVSWVSFLHWSFKIPLYQRKKIIEHILKIYKIWNIEQKKKKVKCFPCPLPAQKLFWMWYSPLICRNHSEL